MAAHVQTLPHQAVFCPEASKPQASLELPSLKALGFECASLWPLHVIAIGLYITERCHDCSAGCLDDHQVTMVMKGQKSQTMARETLIEDKAKLNRLMR